MIILTAEQAQLVLDDLQNLYNSFVDCVEGGEADECFKNAKQSIAVIQDAIRAARAQDQAEQEPVAWMCWIDSDEEMNPANAQLTSYEPKAYAKRKPLYAAPQPVKQEPLVRFCPGCGSIGEVDSKYRDCCPDGTKARLVPSRFAEECQGLFNLAIGNVAPVQEPVAWRWPTHNGYAYAETHFDDEGGEPLYAAPVRTKDLTPYEITALIRDGAAGGGWQGFAQRVIAADREKNK